MKIKLLQHPSTCVRKINCEAQHAMLSMEHTYLEGKTQQKL